MEEIKQILASNRPNISKTSIQTYSSIIKNLYMKMSNKTDIEKAPRFFERHYEKVIQYLKEKHPFKTRKTKLAAVIVLLTEKSKAKPFYQKQMLADIEKTNEENDKQEKSDKEEQNWKSMQEIKDKQRELKKKTQPLFKNPSKRDLDRIMEYVIASVYTLIPPRRLLDYTSFKVTNIDKEKDNYMDKNTFVFNKYKTAKKYQKQIVKIPPVLRMLITRYSKLHDNDYLLFSKKGKPLTQVELNKTLNSIFGVSVNMLRHIYVSENIQMTPLEDIKSLSKQMGNSAEQIIRYKKFDSDSESSDQEK